MLALKLRPNKEILTVECSEPTIFRLMWVDMLGQQVKVGVDAEMSATIYRDDEKNGLRGLSRDCKPGELVAVEVRSPGVFQCQVTKVKDDEFTVRLEAPDDFLFEFMVEQSPVVNYI